MARILFFSKEPSTGWWFLLLSVGSSSESIPLNYYWFRYGSQGTDQGTPNGFDTLVSSDSGVALGGLPIKARVKSPSRWVTRQGGLTRRLRARRPSSPASTISSSSPSSNNQGRRPRREPKKIRPLTNRHRRRPGQSRRMRVQSSPPRPWHEDVRAGRIRSAYSIRRLALLFGASSSQLLLVDLGVLAFTPVKTAATAAHLDMAAACRPAGSRYEQWCLDRWTDGGTTQDSSSTPRHSIPTSKSTTLQRAP